MDNKLEIPLSTKIGYAAARLTFETSRILGITENFSYRSPEAFQARELLFLHAAYIIKNAEENLNRPRLFVDAIGRGVEVKIVCGPSTNSAIVDYLRATGADITQRSKPIKYDMDIIDTTDVRLTRKANENKPQLPEVYYP